MAFVAPFLPFIAMGASAAGSILKGVSAAESAGYQAQVARNNAIVESQNAQHAAGATAAAVEKTGLEERAAGASARAGIAANNIDVNTGSAADVQTTNREMGAFDQAVTANRGAEAVYGYQTQATNEASTAILKQSEVGPDIAGGILGAVGDVAGGFQNLPGAGGGGGGSGGASDAADYAANAPGVGSDYQFMSGNPTTEEEVPF